MKILSNLVGFSIIAFASLGAHSAEFASHNRVLAGKKLVHESYTILVDDAIYDLLIANDKVSRISVYRLKDRKFRILNSARETQVVLGTDELNRFLASASIKARKSKVPFFRFSADPEFKEKLQADRLVLSSADWTYDVETTSERSAEIGKEFRVFADSFAKLNGIWSPICPNARLKLNDALSRHKKLPVRINVELQIGGKLNKQHSTHEYAWSLSKQHKDYIVLAEQRMRDFRFVKLQEFWNEEFTASAK